MPDDLIDVLKPWGITPAAVAVLPGGEKNDNHLVVPASGNRVVVRRYRTSTIPEIEYELHATAFLAQNGYPTPAPVRTEDGTLWRDVDGRPTAVFTFADGVHPPEVADGYWSGDLTIGRDAAALAGLLHAVTDRRAFPGKRMRRREPLELIGAFLDSPYARLPVLSYVVDELADQYTHMSSICTDDVDLPQGLVHNDISAQNLLLDRVTGRVAGLR